MCLPSLGAPFRACFSLSLLALGVILSAGCAPSQAQIYAAAEQQFQADQKTLSPQVVTVHSAIPVIAPDSPDSCGINCLDMLLAYEKTAIPAEAANLLRLHAANNGGIPVDDIVGVLKAAGFKCLRKVGSMRWPSEYTDPEARAWYSDISNPLSQIHFKRPVILRIMVRTDVYHFILLAGYDEPTRRLIVMYPGAGPMVVKAELLLPMWDQAGNVFVAYKAPDIAPTPAPRIAPADPAIPAPNAKALGIVASLTENP